MNEDELIKSKQYGCGLCNQGFDRFNDYMAHGCIASAREGDDALTPRPLRLDDEVFAECQRLGKEYGTINEGLRAKLLNAPLEASDVAISDGVTGRKVKPAQPWKRGPRPKGDRQR